MGKIAYLDCPTGIAGDMCLGALLDAGLALADLEAGLKGLGLDAEYRLVVQRVQRCGQAATQVTVQLAEAPAVPRRHLPQIEQRIQQSQLPDRVIQNSLAIFRRLAAAEAAVHGVAPEQVHFHEVGATDALVDIVGTCFGLDQLGVETLYCSALPTGGGTVWAAHGRLPVPAPAVLQLLTMAQAPIYSNGIDRELVTPTGAAIATTLAQRLGPPPAMQLQQVGLGAGGRDLPIPNILRLWIGVAPAVGEGLASETTPHIHGDHTHPRHDDRFPSSVQTAPTETLVELQTQLDDLSPQIIGYLYEALFQAGAVDIFTQAIGMKKCRPGILLTVLCFPAAVNACETLIFQETTTLGIRLTVQQRRRLHRDLLTLETAYGAVRVKVARYSADSNIINLQPEYEDCAQLARSLGLPWKQIHQAALSQAYRLIEA